MSVLANGAAWVRELARKDESVPFLASVSGLAILVLGFGLHFFMVRHKQDLVPLFAHPVPAEEVRRVTRALEEDEATYVVAGGAVWVSRAQRDQLVARFEPPAQAPRATNPLHAEGAARAAAVPVAEGPGAPGRAWPIYNLMCDADDGPDGLAPRRGLQAERRTGR